MKQLVEKHIYRDHIDSVMKIYLDPEETFRKFRALGGRNIQVQEKTKQSDRSLSRVIQREVPASPPKALKRFIGAWAPVDQEEDWRKIDDDCHECLININIHGLPAKVTSKLRITADGDSCTNHIEVSVDSKIPLVGKLLENYIAEETIEFMKKENDYILKKLGEQRQEH